MIEDALNARRLIAAASDCSDRCTRRAYLAKARTLAEAFRAELRALDTFLAEAESTPISGAAR